MKTLKLHNLGKADLESILKMEFTYRKAEIKNKDKLSEEEKLKQIQELEIELKKKMQKAKWSLF
ncbi:hypothetical protein [Flavobacterium sp.]|uniref:hypothetical protein n=1 Tax=Flavobacterium sp. TaxID=239 RepID=UPI0035273796